MSNIAPCRFVSAPTLRPELTHADPFVMQPYVSGTSHASTTQRAPGTTAPEPQAPGGGSPLAQEIVAQQRKLCKHLGLRFVELLADDAAQTIVLGNLQQYTPQVCSTAARLCALQQKHSQAKQAPAAAAGDARQPGSAKHWLSYALNMKHPDLLHPHAVARIANGDPRRYGAELFEIAMEIEEALGASDTRSQSSRSVPRAKL